MSSGSGKTPVPGKKRHIKRLGESKIGSVIGRDGMTKLPDPGKKYIMWIPLQAKGGQVIERLFRPDFRNLSLQHVPPQNLCHLKVNKVGNVQAPAGGKHPISDHLRAIKAQQEVDESRGVKDDQRSSRSSRTRSAGGRETFAGALPSSLRRISAGAGRSAMRRISLMR